MEIEKVTLKVKSDQDMNRWLARTSDDYRFEVDQETALEMIEGGVDWAMDIPGLRDRLDDVVATPG